MYWKDSRSFFPTHDSDAEQPSRLQTKVVEERRAHTKALRRENITILKWLPSIDVVTGPGATHMG